MDNPKTLIVVKTLTGGLEPYINSLRLLTNTELLVLYPKKNNFSMPKNYQGITMFVADVVRIINAYRKFRPQIMIGVESYANLLICLLGLVDLRLKIITTFHNNIGAIKKSLNTKPFQIINRVLLMIFLRRANMIVGCSEGVTKSVKSYVGSPVREDR